MGHIRLRYTEKMSRLGRLFGSPPPVTGAIGHPPGSYYQRESCTSQPIKKGFLHGPCESLFLVRGVGRD